MRLVCVYFDTISILKIALKIKRKRHGLSRAVQGVGRMVQMRLRVCAVRQANHFFQCLSSGTTACMCARTCSLGQASLAICSAQNAISCSWLV